MNTFAPRRSRTAALIAMLAVLVVAPGAVRAADEGPGAWDPTAPLPDDFDWVQLTSGEWLKGEIVVLYDDTLEFDSDQLDTLSLDFEDIQQIRSARTVQVGLLGGEVATGKLLVDGDEVRILGDEERKYERSQVLSITAGEPRERNFWSGRVGAGANFRRGNSDQTETNLVASFKRRTVRNRIGLDYLANYNLTDDVTVTDNQRATASWDRFVSDRFFLSPFQLEYFRDPFQNIAHRFTAGAGAGFQILDTPDIDWQVSAGIAYQHSQFDEVPAGDPESASTPALRVGTEYDHELTNSIDFTVLYRFFLVDEESGQYTHHFLAGFDVEVTGSLDFYVNFVWDRIEKPRPTADGVVPKKDDYRLNLGLGWDF